MKEVVLDKSGRRFFSPVEEQIQAAFDESADGDYAEVGVAVRDLDKGYFFKIWFWIKSDSEVIAFAQTSKFKGEIYVSASSRRKDEVLYVDDAGGGVLKLNTRFLVSRERAIEIIKELVECHELSIKEEGWERLPSDFV